MFKSKKASVKREVIISFSILIGIIFILATIIYLGLKKVETNNKLLTLSAVPRLTLVEEINQSIGTVQASVFQHVLCANVKEMQIYEQSILDDVNLNSERLKKYEKYIISETGWQLYKNLVEKRKIYLKLTEQLLELSKQNRDNEAKIFAETKQSLTFAEYQNAMQDIVDFVGEQVIRSSKETEEFISRAELISNFLLGIGLIVGLVMGFVISNITRKLKEENKILENEVIERIKAEEKLYNLNRMYACLSQVNQTIVRVRNRDQLFKELCNVAIKYGKFKMSWIGLIDYKTNNVKPVASSGDENGYLKNLRITLDNESEETGPFKISIREKKCFVCNNVESDPLIGRWKEEALKREYRAMAAVPIIVNGKAIGIFNIYVSEIDFFDEEEIKLLEEIGLDISFALEGIEKEGQRIEAEKKLRRYEFIVNASQDHLTLIDRDYYYMAASKSYCEAHNKSESEIFYLTVADIWGDDVFKYILKQNLDDCFKGNIVTFRTWLEFPGAGLKFCDITYSPYRDSDGNITHAVKILRDITKQRLAAQELYESKERYRRFFEGDLAGDLISTVDGKLIDCNTAFLRIFGFESKDEALNYDFKHLYPDVKYWDQLINIIRKEKKLEYHEIELKRKDGKQVFVVANIVGLFNEDGELIKLMGYLFDDTKRKHLEENLRQIQKLEGIGKLAGGIAHDFNNILGIILGHCALIERLTPGNTKLVQSVDTINKAVQRGTALVQQILTFARKTEIVFDIVDPNIVVNDFVKLIKQTFPKTVEFSLQIGKKIPSIMADSNQLNQVLLNLSINARDAMPKGGVITFGTSVIISDDLKKLFSNVSGEKYVCISITDTGYGMEPAMKEHIFEPFFTTKKVGEGTGLGLPVVYGIISSHKGYIDVQSEVGAGTTFYLYLPVPENQNILSSSKNQEMEEISGGSETLLLIEDEEMLREFIETILVGKGYKILTASDGYEAINVFKNYVNEIDLVLMDMGLPKISGRELYFKLKEINPNIKVIIASGYLEPNQKSELLGAGVKDFIQKPYKRDTIFKKIREIIDIKNK